MTFQSRRTFVSGAFSGLSLGAAGMARADHSPQGCHATSHTYKVSGWTMAVQAENSSQHGTRSDHIYRFTITHTESGIQFVFHTGTTAVLQKQAAQRGTQIKNLIQDLAGVDWFVNYANANLPLRIVVSFNTFGSGGTVELTGHVNRGHNNHASGLGFMGDFQSARMSDALWAVARSETSQLMTEIDLISQRHWVTRYDLNPQGIRELLEVSKALTKKYIFLPQLDPTACTVAPANTDDDLSDQIEDLIVEEVLSDCFLTTACCDMFSRPDSCKELQSLRAFRDGWLARQPFGRPLIEEYYRIAPRICRAIAADSRGKWELLRVYTGTILPCVALSRIGANRLTHHLYCRLVRRLSRKYNIA